MLEAGSAPEGGSVNVRFDEDTRCLILTMGSDDLSTLRAMLNSYLGLVTAALKAAYA